VPGGGGGGDWLDGRILSELGNAAFFKSRLVRRFSNPKAPAKPSGLTSGSADIGTGSGTFNTFRAFVKGALSA